MKAKELFAEEATNPSFEGIVVTDNMVLLVDCSKEQNVDIDDYAVVQAGLKSTSGSLNPEEKTNSYIRQGKSTTKTGTQREIGFELDRYVGDEFQDFALSHDMLYAIGQKAVVNYAYFNMITGVGEKGKGTLSISSDAGGNAEENLTVSGSIKKSGAIPAKLTYQGLGGYELLTAQEAPTDWSSKYNTYFIRSNGAFVAVAAAEGAAPAYEASKYYKKKTAEG